MPVAAQQGSTPDILPFELDRNADYTDLVRFRRLQDELVYIDRLNGEIPMDGLTLRQAPRRDEELANKDELTRAEIISRTILLLGLAALAILIWRNRNLLAMLLGQTPKRPAAGNAAAAPATRAEGPATDPSLLARLRAMADREAAIVMLLQAALSEAATANGLRISRSETAREFLRRLPPSWRHHAPLRRLVMTEELVQFGGRSLAEDTFEQCLHDAAPIVGGRIA